MIVKDLWKICFINQSYLHRNDSIVLHKHRPQQFIFISKVQNFKVWLQKCWINKQRHDMPPTVSTIITVHKYICKGNNLTYIFNGSCTTYQYIMIQFGVHYGKILYSSILWLSTYAGWPIHDSCTYFIFRSLEKFKTVTYSNFLFNYLGN